MKLFGSSESKRVKYKNSENIFHLKFMQVVLAYCNIVNTDYPQESRVLYTFVPNKPFGSKRNCSNEFHTFKGHQRP